MIVVNAGNIIALGQKPVLIHLVLRDPCTKILTEP